MNSKTDYKRLFIIGCAILVSGTVAFYVQPLMHGNKEAIGIIVTVFSILAGFIVAIITLVGEPAFGTHVSWKNAQLYRSTVYNRLTRQKYLFITYLATLGFILAATLIDSEKYVCVSLWIERIYIFLASFAFISSLMLPAALMKIQMDRYDQLVKEKRRKAGLND